MVDVTLEEEVGDTGFVGYMKLIAREGFSITDRLIRASNGLLFLRGNVVYMYLMGELVIAALMAAVLARRAAIAPFDEENDVWYGPLTLLGAASSEKRKELLNLLDTGQYQHAGALLTTEELKLPRMDVYIRTSGNVNNNVYVQVNTVKRNGQSLTLNSGMMSASDFILFSQSVQDTALV